MIRAPYIDWRWCGKNCKDYGDGFTSDCHPLMRDIYACGGVHNIERSLEAESYWYARIGEVQGELDGSSLTLRHASFSNIQMR
jgi:hypothetical protein